MDVAYNQHSHTSRRKNRSSTNLNHLTLAPLTSKLPLNEDDGDIADPPPSTPSYLQGKSAPTTPRLLSRSPGRSHSRTSSSVRLPKSKSASHLAAPATSPGRRPHPNSLVTSPAAKRRSHDPSSASAARERTDSDWLLRVGALISTETRESKGQAWLISRASSTSLTGVRDVEEEAFDRELAFEREHRGGSRRHSLTADDGGDHASSPPYSRYGSRSQSRAGSRAGSRSQMMTPLERQSVDGYFAGAATGPVEEDSSIAGPDFVNLDEMLETVEDPDTTVEDEAYVRRLVKKGNVGGMGTWFGSVLGVQLFSVEEDSEESDGEDETTEGESEEAQPRRSSSTRRLEGLTADTEERLPPPRTDEGGWHDAAWLLTVASKVLL